MWSGFSSEIETDNQMLERSLLLCRMWSGFSSEIETHLRDRWKLGLRWVACGAASRLRLKRRDFCGTVGYPDCRMWSGFSSEIETHQPLALAGLPHRSHVERLLV